jgi:MATE family multidrug resistance protein
MSQTTQKTYWNLLRLALPVSLSQLGHISVGVVDTIVAGKISDEVLSAATLALSIFFPFFMLYIGFSYGLSPLVSKAHGEGNIEKIRCLLRNAWFLHLMLIVLSFVLILVGYFMVPYLNQPKEIIPLAQEFIIWFTLSLLPLTLFQTLKQFLEGLGQTKHSMMISVFGNLVNVMLNVVLVFGVGTWEGYGYIGIVWATFIARSVMALLMIIYFFNYKQYAIYRMEWWKVDWNTLFKDSIFNKSIPIGMQMFFESLAFSSAAILVGMFGTISLASHQIVLSIASVTYMIISGVGAAATVKISFAIGASNHKLIKQTIIQALFTACVFMFICSLILFVLNEKIPNYYTNEFEVIKTCSQLLLFAAFFQLADGVQVVALGILRGFGDVLIPSLLALFSYVILGLGIGSYFAFIYNLGVFGIWMGLTLGLFTASITLLIRIRKVYRNQMIL